MDLKLTGKVAIVSGAALGIGYGITKMLRDEGALVVAGDLDPTPLEGMEGVTSLKADISSAEGSQELVDLAIATHGKIDILVNNVGVFPYRDSFLSTTIEDWRRSIDINFMSALHLSRAVLPHMMERKSGSIVSIASDAGRQPDVFFVDYSVTKAMILSLSKSLSIEFGPHGIRSNTVSPGPTRTASWDKPGGFAESLAKEYGLEPEAAIEHFAKVTRKLPVGHLGKPEDVAAVVAFLASDISSQVTGADYTVNGGSIISA